jgi:hypothetical protein
MESVIKLHTPERLFVGGSPTTPDECLKRGCLVLGFSPQIFASHPTQRARIMSTKGAGTLNETSAVSDVLRNRFCHYGPMNITAATVESLLRRTKRDDKSQHLETAVGGASQTIPNTTALSLADRAGRRTTRFNAQLLLPA